jgi:hypothetical protein
LRAHLAALWRLALSAGCQLDKVQAATEPQDVFGHMARTLRDNGPALKFICPIQR